MFTSKLSIVACLLFFLGSPLQAAKSWQAMHTDHLTVITDEDSKAARLLGLLSEERQAIRVLGMSFPESRPIIIVITADSHLLESAWPVNGVQTGTLGGLTYGFADEIYILVDSRNWDFKKALLHEYVHALLRQKYLRPALWLDEGIAENLSAYEVQGKTVQFGRLNARHRWKPDSCVTPLMLQNILSADNADVHYDAHSVGDFYHLSALVVRYLIDRQGVEGLGHLLDFISTGLSQSDALHSVYGLTVSEINSAAIQHCNASSTLRLYPYEPVIEEPIQISSISGREFNYLYFGLLARVPGRAPQAMNEFKGLLEYDPKDRLASKGMGIALLYDGRYAEALQYLSSVVLDFKDDPTTLYYLLVACNRARNCDIEKYRDASSRLLDLLPNLEDVKAWRAEVGSPGSDYSDGGFLSDTDEKPDRAEARKREIHSEPSKNPPK